MIPEGGLVLFTAEEIDETSQDEVIVTMTLTGRDSVHVGRLLDLIEHAAGLGDLTCTLDVPGYHQAFYGWEKDQR